ncbi:cocosin 1 [Elaeis guineensis]|uniref:Cocosin 1 n=1 Tax=Elaeis guineensis var. tenera TaxID=51953 RepID=A0A6J0PPI1_ELAGV|nr:cocosin 1 [Elaeis guineensis]
MKGMVTSAATLLPFSLCLLLLCRPSLAQFERSPWQSVRRSGEQSQCGVEKLNALEPIREVRSEAGVTEYYQNNAQFECAGVAAFRRTIEPRGLLLPSFSNAPRLVYIIQGRGIYGTVIPGCPETFQSFQQSESEKQSEKGQRQRFRDEHQRIHHFKQGDVIAIAAGVAHWCYNDGDTPVIAFTVSDISNSANQLDENHRQFLLAGRRSSSWRQSRKEQEPSSEGNILSGFDTKLLAAAIGVDREVARKLQCKDDQRGEIVRVEKGLEVLRPSSEKQEREERGRGTNGLEEAMCSMRNRENIDSSRRADVYIPRGGRITNLNSQKLPMLSFIQLSAERVVLYKNAMLAPHWNINAHSVTYCTGGRGGVQVVDNNGKTVFDGELRQGQLLVIPQNFAVIKQAGNEGFEFTSIKTIDNAMVNTIVGKASALRGMPEEVLMNSYRINRNEARRVKFNRGHEMAIFSPRSEGRADA